tara:strand:+ start:66 stop:398 length:333 start_codon:yes stop_codon:yes gene_type:complete
MDMKISAIRLNEIIKEEVRRVQEMPEQDTEVDAAHLINKAATSIEQAAGDMSGLVNPDAPEEAKYDYADDIAADLVAAVQLLNKVHELLVPGAAMEEAEIATSPEHDKVD